MAQPASVNVPAVSTIPQQPNFNANNNQQKRRDEKEEMQEYHDLLLG